VALALSTTRPGRATSARQPETLDVDFAAQNTNANTPAPASVPASSSPVLISPPGALLARISNLSEATEKPAEPVPASAAAGAAAFQTVYAIPGRIAIKAGGEAKRLQLGTEKLDPSLLVLTVPRLDATAYLYARLTLPKTSQPMLAGSVALFRDGVFTGNGEFPLLAPGEEYELGFGADERVKVKYAVAEDKKGQTGTFTTSRLEERHYAITVRNLHARPIQLHVLDRIPVSKQQDINVVFAMDKGPQPSAADVNGRRGVMLWAMKTAPDAETQLGFGYRITSPADRPIIYRDLDVFNSEVFHFGATTRF
jgi:uncharacterized protein (TIGR02231 family)